MRICNSFVLDLSEASTPAYSSAVTRPSLPVTNAALTSPFSVRLIALWRRSTPTPYETRPLRANYATSVETVVRSSMRISAITEQGKGEGRVSKTARHRYSTNDSPAYCTTTCAQRRNNAATIMR